jgi:hypothetical protein
MAAGPIRTASGATRGGPAADAAGMPDAPADTTRRRATTRRDAAAAGATGRRTTARGVGRSADSQLGSASRTRVELRDLAHAARSPACEPRFLVGGQPSRGFVTGPALRIPADEPPAVALGGPAPGSQALALSEPLQGPLWQYPA